MLDPVAIIEEHVLIFAEVLHLRDVNGLLLLHLHSWRCDGLHWLLWKLMVPHVPWAITVAMHPLVEIGFFVH